MRSIKFINKAQKVNMGGIFLDQAIPAGPIDQVDPFILIHHWSKSLPGGQHQRDVGVGPHPHRGFSPVTLIFKGGVHHRDSGGGDSQTFAGGAQWMNSGSGIVHSERPLKSIAENGGEFEIIQLWINVPKSHKMDTPAYFSLQKEDIPMISYSENQISTAVIAGEFEGIRGPAQSVTPMIILRLDGQKSEKVEIPISKNYNLCLYQLDGEFLINGMQNSIAKQLTVFHNDGDKIALECINPGRLVLLAGEPIQEPVVSYGPFVMNNYHEIQDAISDYQDGRFGTLIENFN